MTFLLDAKINEDLYLESFRVNQEVEDCVFVQFCSNNEVAESSKALLSQKTYNLFGRLSPKISF